MNKKRREDIRKIISQIEYLIDGLENIKDEEDDARCNMPENLESSEQYTKSEEASDIIGDVVTEIRDTLNTLSENI